VWRQNAGFRLVECCANEEHQVIPDEAVEAAYDVSQHLLIMTAEIELILTAAAPFIAAQAWDEGRKHGATYPYGERGLATDDNPYRSGT
jgi:hypothetical protein